MISNMIQDIETRRLSLSIDNDPEMAEFHKQLIQLQLTAQHIDGIETIDINHFVNEIEQIGRQLKYSQEFLLKEIQRLKQDLDTNYAKLYYANDLRDIDQITLKRFKTKFQDLTRLLGDVKTRETNAWHLIQILRVNTSRLWHIFETTTGATITQELLYEDLEKLINLTQIEKDEQNNILSLIEKEHGDLLIKMKQIELSLEDFRTQILDITRDNNEIKQKIKTKQQITDRIQDQSSQRLNHLILNTEDVQTLLLDYKSVVNEIHQILKFIFQIQNQIELHHKSVLIYQTKLEKYKQDLISIIMKRTNQEDHIENLKKRIHQQTENLEQIEYQQRQMILNRQQFQQQIHILETKKMDILNNQQTLLDEIKQATNKNQFLEKEIFHSNHAVKKLQCSYRQLIKEHNRQQDKTKDLNKTIQTNERRLQITKVEINQLTAEVKQQNQRINLQDVQIDSHTKEIQDLENCLSTTNEELNNQHTKVGESKAIVKTLTQKLHKLIADEKPLAKEISHSQKQITQNEMNHSHLQLNLKQNEMRINQYNTIIGKLNIDFKQNDQILSQEYSSLKHYAHQKDKSIQNINKLNMDLKHTEYNYQNLKEIYNHVENENIKLKQQYADLSFVVQLFGQRQSIDNNELQVLYGKIKCLTKKHLDKVEMIEQSKSDLQLLQKYYNQLRSHNHKLHQSLLFKSDQDHEYLNSQYISNQFSNFQNQLELEMKTNSNHIHYWRTLMISSPEKFNNISKLFLIKKKLVKKSNELLYLKKIFWEKETLHRYLNQIYVRRDKLTHRMNTNDVLKDHLVKQKKLRNDLKLNKTY